MNDLVVLYTTWPDAETAEAFGRRAVAEQLAACANVLAPMRSVYRWEGEVRAEAEIAMLLKTTAGAVDRLGDLILRYHPYETPCILAIPVNPLECNAKYAAWVESQVPGPSRVV